MPSAAPIPVSPALLGPFAGYDVWVLTAPEPRHQPRLRKTIFEVASAAAAALAVGVLVAALDLSG